MKTPEPKKDRKTRTAIFANSKGGVGKSTLALLTCLGLASRFKRASVELIDLDNQSTSSDSLQRFANDRFSVINDDHLFLASGSPNNGNIVNHIDSEPRNNENDSFLLFDSPAGSEPARSSFLLRCNLIFVPTPVSSGLRLGSFGKCTAAAFWVRRFSPYLERWNADIYRVLLGCFRAPVSSNSFFSFYLF